MRFLRDDFTCLATMTCLLPGLLAASVFAKEEPISPAPTELTPAAARAAIDKMYKEWGRGRVALDKETLDSILAPDFYVSLYGQKLSREKFLHDITQKRKGAGLTRFDTEILTVQKTGDDWTVVIAEKFEFTINGSDGETRKVYSHWVTRDGWRYDGHKWLVTYSEAIGHENWKSGTKPPIRDW